ncbi:MAG: HD domain-containing protein [Spirochaetota bacterium]
MTHQKLHQLEKWFIEYADSCIHEHPAAAEELLLKKDHTIKVQDGVRTIAAELRCNEALTLMALAAALLHDVGRFRQYIEYGTFADSRSEDHAQLGLKVIHEHNLLDDCEPHHAEMMEFAIRHHNKLAVPAEGDDESLFLAKILRDADKLDIFRVVTGYYRDNDSEGLSAMLGLPDNDVISQPICHQILEGSIPRMEHLASCNDLKLMQMSWIYDINFPVTLRLVQERGYLEMLYHSLPDLPVIREVYTKIDKYINNTV